MPFPIQGACATGFTGRLRGARGGRPRTGLFLPAAGWCRGSSSGLAPHRTCLGLRDRVVPGEFLWRRSWAACAAVVWRVWTRSLTRPVSRAAHMSTGELAGAAGLFRVDTNTALSGSEDATPGSRAFVRVRAPLGRVGQVGLPGAFWCASPFPVAVFVVLFVCSAPSGLGLPSFLFFFYAPPLSLAFRVFLPALPLALARVPQLCCPCRCSLCGTLSPLWRWLVFCGVACCDVCCWAPLSSVVCWWVLVS